MAFTLTLSDGTTTLDFLDASSGFLLQDGGLDIPTPKRIEVHTDQSIAAIGSRLVDYSYANRTITLEFGIYGADYDTVIGYINDLNSLLSQGMRYWTDDVGSKVELNYQWSGATNATKFGVISGQLNLPDDIMSLEKLLWYDDVNSRYEVHDCELVLECEPFGYGADIKLYNMVPNAGFEWDQDEDGEPDYWDVIKSTTTGTLDTSTVKFGHSSVKIVTGGASGDSFESDTIAIAASTEYRVSAWVYVTGGTVTLKVHGDVSGLLVSSSTQTATSTWVKLSVSATTGASDSTVYLDFEMPLSTTCYIDGVMMMKASDVTGSGTPDAWCDYTERLYNTLSIGTDDSVDSQQGTLAYLTNAFQDTGQNFGEWSISSGRAHYKLTITNSDATTTWGYMKDAFTTTNMNDSIYVYTDLALSSAGWNGTNPSGKTPSTYIVEPLIVRHNSAGIAMSGTDAPSPLKMTIENIHASYNRNASFVGVRTGVPPRATFGSAGAWASTFRPLTTLEIEDADSLPIAGSLATGDAADSGEGTSKILEVTNLAAGNSQAAYWDITPNTSYSIDTIRGKYRQIVRVKMINGTNADLKIYSEVRYYNGVFTLYTSPSANNATGLFYNYFDLGIVEFPPWTQRTNVPDAFRYYLWMENAGSTNSMDFNIDCVYLLPADGYKYVEHLSGVGAIEQNTSTLYDNIDHDDMVFYSSDPEPSSTTVLTSGKFSESLGEPMYLYPDEDITLYILNKYGNYTYADATIKCRFWYRPSYLQIRGA